MGFCVGVCVRVHKSVCVCECVRACMRFCVCVVNGHTIVYLQVFLKPQYGLDVQHVGRLCM